MPAFPSPGAVDYVVVGHLACDHTPQGVRLGGTAAYAALTAQALGLRVGIVTAWGGEISLNALQGIVIQSKSSPHSTTFENIYTPEGRIQYIHHRAAALSLQDIPAPWCEAPVLHLGPIAQEVPPILDDTLKPGLLGMTLQGWLRAWDENGRVHPCDWSGAATLLPRADAAVLSREDVNGDEKRIQEFASYCRLLVVTEGAGGARLYWDGREYHFDAPRQHEVDATGAGDVFAAAFFYRFAQTHDPCRAARFATYLASFSVTRPGLAGIPTPQEIQSCLEVS